MKTETHGIVFCASLSIDFRNYIIKIYRNPKHGIFCSPYGRLQSYPCRSVTTFSAKHLGINIPVLSIPGSEDPGSRKPRSIGGMNNRVIRRARLRLTASYTRHIVLYQLHPSGTERIALHSRFHTRSLGSTIRFCPRYGLINSMWNWKHTYVNVVKYYVVRLTL